MFLGLNELPTKYDLGNYELKLYRMSKGIAGKTENFTVNTDGQWQLELPIMLAEETSSELNGIFFIFMIFSV